MSSQASTYLLIAATLLASACSVPAPKKKPLEPEPKPPPQVILDGVKVRSWEGSVLVTRGRAARLTYDRTSSAFEGEQVQLRFPREQTRQGAVEDLEVKAPAAIGNLSTRQAEGWGGVQIRSPSGLMGETERAHFDGVGLVASGATPVSVEGPGFSVEANRFDFYLVTEELVFDGDVQSRLSRAGER